MQARQGDLIVNNLIVKVTESIDNDLSTIGTFNYVMGDSRKYPYTTTSLQIIFVYKQVICQVADKFSPDKKESLIGHFS